MLYHGHPPVSLRVFGNGYWRAFLFIPAHEIPHAPPFTLFELPVELMVSGFRFLPQGRSDFFFFFSCLVLRFFRPADRVLNPGSCLFLRRITRRKPFFTIRCPFSMAVSFSLSLSECHLDFPNGDFLIRGQ